MSMYYRVTFNKKKFTYPYSPNMIKGANIFKKCFFTLIRMAKDENDLDVFEGLMN
jgi:hypothetical protein